MTRYPFPNFMIHARPLNQVAVIDTVSIDQQSIDLLGPILWAELFNEVSTAEQLFTWESKLPNYECSCRSFYSAWKQSNLPDFPLSNQWKYDLKTAVNAKLGKPNLSWPEACQLYGWDSTQPPPDKPSA